MPQNAIDGTILCQRATNDRVEEAGAARRSAVWRVRRPAVSRPLLHVPPGASCRRAAITNLSPPHTLILLFGTDSLLISFSNTPKFLNLKSILQTESIDFSYYLH